MKITEIRCDRCNGVIKPDPHLVVTSNTFKLPYDLCNSCEQSFKRFMRNENDLGEYRYEQVCTHHIPCAGPCNSEMFKRVRRHVKEKNLAARTIK